MARPRTDAKILELRGAFDRNPQRRRHEPPRGAPLDPEPDPSWRAPLKRAWRELVATAPEGLYEQSDRGALRILAQLYVLMDEAKPGSPTWIRLTNAALKYHNHLGLTPKARERLLP